MRTGWFVGALGMAIAIGAGGVAAASGYSNYDVKIMLAVKERTYRAIEPQPELSCGEVAFDYRL